MSKDNTKKSMGVVLIVAFLVTPMAPVFAQVPEAGIADTAPVVSGAPSGESAPEPVNLVAPEAVPQGDSWLDTSLLDKKTDKPSDVDNSTNTIDPQVAPLDPGQDMAKDAGIVPGKTDKKDKKDKKDSGSPQVMSFSANQSGSGNGSSALAQQKLPQIDKNTGALQYEYPLVVPPGRNNVQPNLSLSYSSNSNENGIFGQGWSLNIPYIQRLSKLGVDKLYDQNAAQYFYSSLDGELVHVNGPNYQAKTENGSFNQYTFSNNQWTVTLKDGSRYSFGVDESARQNNPNSTNDVYKWMLQEVRDTNDNYVSFSYFKDAGQIYPLSIKYTGHGSVDGIFEVVFQRASRTDNNPSSITGFLVANNYYISEIDNKVNGTWSSKYVLNYSQSPESHKSLLASITVSGQDDSASVTTLPSTTFNYQNGNSGWSSVITAWKLPTDGPSCGVNPQTLLADINGDGLVDVILDCQAEDNRVFLNTGNGWSSMSTIWKLPTISNSGLSCNVNASTLLADLNGDGLTDVILDCQAQNNAVFLNVGNGWSSSSTTWKLPTQDNGPSCPFNPTTYLSDINGDGLTDVVLDCRSEDNRVFLNTGSGWSGASTTWKLPTQNNAPVSCPINLQTLLADINGDGLIDVVLDCQAENNAVYLNTGNGWSGVSTTWKLPTMSNGPSCNVNPKTLLADVNGDGLTDVIIDCQAQNNAVFLNTGNGWSSSLATWKLPTQNNGPSCPFNATTYLPDINGDGLTDVVLDCRSENNVVYLNNSVTRKDLLTFINFPAGGNTTISYKNAAQYTDDSGVPANKLAYPIFTVYQIFNEGYSGPSMGTTYRYQGGVYYYNNSLERQFAGYKQISETDSAGNVTKTYYNTGTGADSSGGQYNDNYFKIGKPYKVEQYGASSNLYSRTINKFDDVDLGSSAHFVKLLQMVKSDYDGNASHRDSAESYTYDNTNGNMTGKVQYGEVSASTDGTFTDTGSDKFTTSYSYAQNSQAYIVGLPSQVTVTDQGATKVKESKFYYDTQTLGSVTIGNLTKKEDWKTGSAYVSNQKAYNSYGLATSETDPLNHVTYYTYDSYNLYPVTVTNPLSQASQYLYDYSSGKVTQETNPNARVFQNVYDGLDRVVAEKEPDIASPATLVVKASYVYTDSANATSVKKSVYLDGSNVVDSYVYVDGLGRKIQERTEAENSNFAVKDYQYNNVGLVQKESLLYFSSGSAKTSATTNNDLYITYAYDALGRVVSLANVVGTTTNAYDDWKVTTTDANNNSKDVYQDAHGSLVQVTEHNGANTYNTYYTYNYLASLTKITDALGNVRNFTYDGLGRRLSAEDLHASGDGTFGVWTYAYDNAGNLTETVNPKSQTVDYTYDNLNRVLTENYTGSSGVEVSYTYDTGTDGVGKLTNVANAAVTKDYTYNALGLPKTETANLNSTNYTTTYDYDRVGNQTMFTNPDNSQVKYSYNLAGALEGIQRKEATDTSFTNVVTNFDYSPEGKVTSQTNANGVVLTNTYDATKLYRLTRKYSVNGSSQVIQDLNYTYDPVGNITHVQDNSATQTAKTADYTYDNLYRLTSAVVSNVASGQTPYTQTFTYNALGNTLTKQETIGNNPTVTTTYAYDGNTGSNYANPHAVTSTTDGTTTVTYTYDNNGNLLSSTGGFTHVFDYNNRLTSSTKDAVVNTYTYDAGGQRVKLSNGATTTYYPTKSFNTDLTAPSKHIFAGDTNIATIQGTASLAQIFYNASDLLNSSGIMTNSAGSIVETMDYFPFGALRIDNQTGSFQEKRKYIAQEYDTDTNLAYLNARYYNATLAVFISQDPVARDNPEKFLQDPQQLNSYSYARNNPITQSDPTGNASQGVPNPMEIMQKAGESFGKWLNQKIQAWNEYKSSEKYQQDQQKLQDSAYQGKIYLGEGSRGSVYFDIMGTVAPMEVVGENAFAVGVRENLTQFSEKIGAKNWKDFPEMLSEARHDAFGLAGRISSKMQESASLHFNLDGFDIQRGLSEGPKLFKGKSPSTSSEFYQIIDSKSLLDKTTFYSQGKAVPTENVMNQVNKIRYGK